VLTVKAQALDSEIKAVPLQSRVANAVLSYGKYLAQIVWPSRLSIFYPNRFVAIFSWQVVAAFGLICTITVLVLWQIKKRPYLAVGWFWYLGTLVPVVGLVHVGDLAHADRYTYVPLLGIFVAIVWGASDLGTRFPNLRTGLVAGGALAVIALAATTARDISYWHDGISISEHAIAVTGPNCLMERTLGETLYTEGRVDEALQHLTRSLQIEPTDTALFDVGTIKFQQGRVDEAAWYFQKALQYPGESRPLAQIHNSLAVLQMREGALADAEKHFRASIALDPASARHRIAYGWLLAKEARYDEAIVQYQEALKAAPDALAYFSLGSALEEQHKLGPAAEAYRKTLAISPNFQEAQVRLNAIDVRRQ
jgi:Tfp pilus assembly protein PilF